MRNILKQSDLKIWEVVKGEKSPNWGNQIFKWIFGVKARNPVFSLMFVLRLFEYEGYVWFRVMFNHFIWD